MNTHLTVNITMSSINYTSYTNECITSNMLSINNAATINESSSTNNTLNKNHTDKLLNSNSTTTTLFAYSYNHPQADGKPLITSINWSDCPKLTTLVEVSQMAKFILKKIYCG